MSALLAVLGEAQGEAAGEGSPDMTRDSVELELDRVPPFSRLNALQFNSKRLIDLMAKLQPKPTIGNVMKKKPQENVSKFNKYILDTIIEEVDYLT